jgi:hypothetical protein
VTVAPLQSINLNVSALDIERALVVARDREPERARFHARYVIPFTNAFVERVEVVTEFRRVVLLAEERIGQGNRGFAYSVPMAQDALQPWTRHVSVLARLRFHPQNAYVGLPLLDISLDGASADAALVRISKEPLLAMSTGTPGEHVPILGAIVEGVYNAVIVGQTQRTATLKVDGKEVAKVKVDFAAVE